MPTTTITECYLSRVCLVEKLRQVVLRETGRRAAPGVKLLRGDVQRLEQHPVHNLVVAEEGAIVLWVVQTGPVNVVRVNLRPVRGDSRPEAGLAAVGIVNGRQIASTSVRRALAAGFHQFVPVGGAHHAVVVVEVKGRIAQRMGVQVGVAHSYALKVLRELVFQKLQ